MDTQTSTSTPYEQLSLYIDGRFLAADGRKVQDVVNPATGAVFAKLPHATREDLDLALAAAGKAFQSWRFTSPLERGKVLRRVAELIRERAPAIARQ